MRRVLVLAPCFAPSSYPPSLRNRLFLLHLASFGWKPTVLSVEPRDMDPPHDPLIGRMLPKDLEVLRTPAFSSRWTRKLGIGDLGLRALVPQMREAERLCRERKFDLVFVSGPPFYAFMTAVRLKKKLGIPYVVDYIDPWVESKNSQTPFWRKRFWSDWLGARLDSLAVRHASGITTVSEGMNMLIRSMYPEHAAKVAGEIPYGVEPEDFEFVRTHVESTPHFNPKDGLFHFVYVGAVWKNALQTFEAILRAIRMIKDTNPSLYAKMRWYFIGTSYAPNAKPVIRPIAERLGLADVVTTMIRRIPYPEALRVMLDTDFIVAVGSDDITYTSSKIFSCILAEKPILAVYHEKSSVVSILKSTDAEEMITFSEAEPALTKISEIAAAIERLCTRKGVKPAIDWKSFDQYSARRMTERLAAVFDRAAAR